MINTEESVDISAESEAKQQYESQHLMVDSARLNELVNNKLKESHRSGTLEEGALKTHGIKYVT